MTITVESHGRKIEVKITPTKAEARYEGDKAWPKINDPAVIDRLREGKEK